MSSVEKMSIQGIRSFGWTDQDKQIIAFFSPLTLILGPNGTGKTTIIESLRYITTGDMPPGCVRGGAFVHDPKVADEREVKGQIRLQFKDVNKKNNIVTRSLLALQKEKRIECKTIDGILTTEGPDKEKISISSKCAQLDQQMSSLLGVSKAILNNVIFCHQEDSCWPLGEGKLVKTKFDDIFAATRYIKALDAIKKSKVELETGVRECRISAKFLKENKTTAEKMSNDLTQTRARLTASLDSINKIQEKLKPLESRLETIMTKQSEIFKLQLSIANIGSKKQQIEKMQRELKDKIEHEYPGDMKELQKLQSEFQAEVRKNEKTLNKLEKQMDLLDQQSKRLQKVKASLNQEVGKRKMEAEAHKEKIKQQKDIIKSLSTEYELDGFEGDITDDKVSEFNNQLSQLIKSCVSDEQMVRSKFEDQEAKLQKKLDNVRDAKSKLEQTIDIKKETVSKSEMEIKRLTRELSTIAASTTKLEQLEHALSKAEYELNDVEKSVDINSLKSEINEFKDQKIQLNAKLDQLNFEINKCHLQNSTRTELDLLKKDKAAKEDKIRKLIARHEDTLKHLLGHVPSENIRYKLDSFIQKQYESSHALAERIQKSRVKLSSKEVNRKLLAEQLKKKEEELKEFEEKLFQLCGSQDFDQGVDLLESSLGALQDEKGALSGMQHLYVRYIDLLRHNKPCCPLCHRGFDEQQDVEELVHELESKLQLIPKQLESKEKNVNEQQLKHNQMVAMKPNIAAIKTLQEKTIPNLKQQVKELNNDIEGLRHEISENEDCLQMKQTDEAVAKSIQTDMVLLDQAQIDIKTIDKTITSLNSKLGPSADSLRTLQQVNSEKNDVQMEFDTLGRKVDSKQQKINDHTEHLHELHKTVNEMREEKLQISSNLQKRNQLEETKLELASVIEQCKNEITENKEKLQPLAVSLDSIQEEKQNLLNDKNTKLNNMQQKLNKIKSNRQHVDLFSKEIEKYLINGGPEALITSEEELKDIESQLDCKETDKQAVAVEIDEIRKSLAQEQVRVRELQDTVQLRQWDEEITALNADVASKSKQLGDFHGTALDKEKLQLDNERRKLIKERDQAEGRQNELQTNITKIQKDLDNDPYKDVDVKYKKNLIQLRTTELASKDLVKYHKALDGAIMRFHSMKMEEINKIIRDLWRNTYRGTDIDYIEICSDADEAGNSSDTLRRVYHYRVVMVKADKKLDMRGRCSAGQKVLASLIIRLALAETFCLKCGILALDEPTTNLDRDNIESLAHALVEIINNRSKQRNFQLIIITHDEDFVELLGRSDYVDYYYRVHKNRDGLSRVDRCTIQGLQM